MECPHCHHELTFAEVARLNGQRSVALRWNKPRRANGQPVPPRPSAPVPPDPAEPGPRVDRNFDFGS